MANLGNDKQISAIPTGPEGFGERMRKLREKKRVSRRVVADFVQTSKNSIVRYERGERTPDITTASRIADYFEVSLDWLIGYEEWEEPTKK